MSSCIEMLPHEAAAIAYSLVGGSGNNSGSSSGTATGGSNVAKSATDVNAVLFSNAMPALGTTLGGTSAASVCNSVLKLIEETLQYLTKVINYAPEESIQCLRQLLKYLFARNYGNRQQQYKPMTKTTTVTFLKSYFKAKCREQQHHSLSKDDAISYKQQTNQPTSTSSMFANVTQQQSSSLSSSSSTTIKPPVREQLSTKGTSVLPDYDSYSSCATTNICGLGDVAVYGHGCCTTQDDDYLLLAELFASGLEFHTWKSEHESELSKHIKLFEPLVIYCLTVSTFL